MSDEIEDKNPNQGWIYQKTYEYEPDRYSDRQFETIAEIVAEVKSLDSEKNPEHHDFMYLLHLNRVAAEIVRNSDLPNKRSVLDALFHTANKDIWGSMIHSERVNRTEDFKSAINYMLMDIGHL